jgi:hypothetical protein
MFGPSAANWSPSGIEIFTSSDVKELIQRPQALRFTKKGLQSRGATASSGFKALITSTCSKLCNMQPG